MAYTRRAMARDIRPSTRLQTRQSRRLHRSTTKTQTLRISKKPKLTPSPSTPRAPTRTIRSHAFTTLTSSPLPTPYISKRHRRRTRTRTDPWTPKRTPKRAPKPRSPPPTHFTCRICCSLLPLADFTPFITKKSARLTNSEIPAPCIPHLTRSPWAKKREPVCKECIGQAMAARHELVGARKVGMGCLEPGCTTYWGQMYVLRFFPVGERLEKYNEDMFKVYLDEARMVTCVKEGCGTRGLAEPWTPGFPQILCSSPICATRYCATCLVPWHVGLNCAEHRASHIDAAMTSPEKETLEMMQARDGRRCPNCFLVIEKDGGCDSMYCEGCKTFFDWGTAASAVPGSKRTMSVGWYGNGNGRGGGEVECEMDALERDERDKGKGKTVAHTVKEDVMDVISS